MATENPQYDPLRNPEVDYERADLSARGIVLFLLGLLVVGVFIELVIWGMFRFMAKSEVLFPQSPANPMVNAQTASAGTEWPLSVAERSRSGHLDLPRAPPASG